MDSASLAMESHKTHQYYKGKVDRANTRFEGLNNRVGRNEGKNLFFSVTIARSKGTQLRNVTDYMVCLLYTSPSPRDGLLSRMPSSA